MSETMRRLQNQAQNYAWGKVGAHSLVANFLPTHEEKPYAELWVGTHPLLESYVGGASLSSQVGSLPYLLKLLSIAMPLSIQIHPNRAQAERLHALDPVRYPDSSPKPELCVALTRMEVLCGLKTEEEAAATVERIGEIRDILSGADGVRDRVARLLQNEGDMQRLTREYLHRTRDDQDECARLARKLDAHFPGDVGVFLALLMNHVTLEPGEAVFVGAGVPHAYLEGDCVEAQTCSNSVVRCGLTSKPKDPAALFDLIAVEKIGRPNVIQPDLDSPAYCYAVPCSDFLLWRVKGGGRLVCSGPTCLVVVQGEGALIGRTTCLEIREGDSCLVTEDVEVAGSAVVYACMQGSSQS